MDKTLSNSNSAFGQLINVQKNYNNFRHHNKILGELGAPHTESFDHMLKQGLKDCVNNMVPIQFETDQNERIELFVESINIEAPTVGAKLDSRRSKVYPMESRQMKSTYSGRCSIQIGWRVNSVLQQSFNAEMGHVPIMIQSDACNLKGLSPKELVIHGEHENEWGGYFIVNGHEKLIRMLLLTRKNYPIAVKRSTWKNKGDHFSDTGVLIRCVQQDQTSKENIIHFLTTGKAKLSVPIKKSMFYIEPILLLKAITNHTDKYIYDQLVQGFEDDKYYVSTIEQMLREVHEGGIHNQTQCKNFLGDTFRTVLFECPPWFTNEETCDYLLKECILIHLSDNEDKFNLLIFMIQKLFQCVQNKHKIENTDGVMMQEVLLGGHLYQKVIKDRVQRTLVGVMQNIKKLSREKNNFLLTHENMLKIKIAKMDTSIQNFLSTGNLISSTGLGVPQNAGLVIIAENINRMRYMSHFRSVHRGSFFVTMRTTEARQLLPDAWGFICPVHTPDGTPCGLLNHLTTNCVISQCPEKSLVDEIPKVMTELGMINKRPQLKIDFENYAVVMLEGKIIGYVRFDNCELIQKKLRSYKIEGKRVPRMMEIAYVPKKKGGQFPGFFLFVGPERMMRPVCNLDFNKIEYIGTFEQVYMNISLTPIEIYPKITTHMELSKTSFLSNLANLIPLPDCNQSPRNMYQCQMGKQTMGTPCQNWPLQSTNKLYRLQTPASPLFRTAHYDTIDMDDFPMGTNAIIAVISYTGYDMEDAMVINKASYERGFAHGSIYKSEYIELPINSGTSYFARDPSKPWLEDLIDTDGLPFIGRILKKGEEYYCYFDSNTAKFVTKKFMGQEDCVVDSVKLCGNDSTPKYACLTTRISRNPSIGDKFASRAGQKGICSQKWKDIDLPFTETGLIPDIMFNPHGFPSRMTIAMMIEVMAGKSAAIHGHLYDATPFEFNEDNTAIDYFGKLLVDGGYKYNGTERLYSGIDGREMKADIFFGVVHYQRLRHMVSDKYQVRRTGIDDIMTRQPVKGRRRGGGVRFGEMEQNALLAHGASFLLQDRLFHGSDKVQIQICQRCESILGPVSGVLKINRDLKTVTSKPICKLCQQSDNLGTIEIPYIFKFLVTQLCSVNINVRLKTKAV